MTISRRSKEPRITRDDECRVAGQDRIRLGRGARNRIDARALETLRAVINWGGEYQPSIETGWRRSGGSASASSSQCAAMRASSRRTRYLNVTTRSCDEDWR